MFWKAQFIMFVTGLLAVIVGYFNLFIGAIIFIAGAIITWKVTRA